jgi:hypothetical protein
MTASEQLIEVGNPGRIVQICEKVVEAPPLTNCRVIALMGMLVYGGLSILDRAKLLLAIRKATGVPEVDARGRAQGTTARDVLRAAAAELPWVPVGWALWADGDLLAALGGDQLQCSVSVWYGLLPTHLRRHSPTFTSGGPGVKDRHDGHEIRLAGAKRVAKGWQVLWIDSLAPADYTGEWVMWSDVRPAVWGNSSQVIATWIERGAALSTSVIQVAGYAPVATATIPRGTQVFAYDAAAITLAGAGRTTADGTASVDGSFAVRQKPQRPPSGGFYHLVDGPHAGQYVRTSDVKLAVNPPTDCSGQVAAATAPLQAEIDERNTAIAAALTALQGVTP